ncbi:hypothetical protein FA95DRAFT_1027389 [Auriscalpium vulgare]|uniref:Uncharacterized protein n=1 Tax=Auriscalpium vulgare TaxID=40419 RepID=A0ACB8R675_9AGAM|nr:hypothetical protein FA95DRAFT_1027389 [Auriscalpium vulgare]
MRHRSVSLETDSRVQVRTSRSCLIACPRSTAGIEQLPVSRGRPLGLHTIYVADEQLVPPTFHRAPCLSKWRSRAGACRTLVAWSFVLAVTSSERTRVRPWVLLAPLRSTTVFSDGLRPPQTGGQSLAVFPATYAAPSNDLCCPSVPTPCQRRTTTTTDY